MEGGAADKVHFRERHGPLSRKLTRSTFAREVDFREWQGGAAEAASAELLLELMGANRVDKTVLVRYLFFEGHLFFLLVLLTFVFTCAGFLFFSSSFFVGRAGSRAVGCQQCGQDRPGASLVWLVMVSRVAK